MPIDETTLAMTFALLGVAFSVVWLALAIYGIRSLRDIRDALSERGEGDGA